jgi:subtilisin family serine protease
MRVMFKLRHLWVLGLALTLSPLPAAEGQLGIPLGNHHVHPTRILARYHQPEAAQGSDSAELLASLGLRIAQQYRIVPGLVSFDEADSSLSRMAVGGVADPAAQARILVERIGALRRSGLFVYAEPNYVQRALLEPTDDAYVDGRLWGLRNDGGQGGLLGADISAAQAWDLTTGSTNVIVAVVDSGIRYTHNDLRTQMWRNPGEIPDSGIDDDGNGIVDDVYGIDASDPDNITGDPWDLDGHGTHVAGTIGAAANNNAPHVGVAWEVQLMACKFLNAFGFGVTEGAIAALQYAAENGASIMNNSWGGGPFSSALFDTVVAIRNQGILFVAAAGNDAANNDEVDSYPANFAIDNVISVAALDRADRLADFSNYGVDSVHLGAPGVRIFSSLATSDSAYAFAEGTSMAAPHVAGVAALIRARFPAISLFELRERLLQTVVPIPALDGITITGGRVNAYKALVAVGDGELEMSVHPASESVLLAGSTQQVFVTVSDLFAVNNATVTGVFVEGLSGTLAFRNDGTGPDETAADNVYSAEFEVPEGISEILIQIDATAPDMIGTDELVRWYVAEPPTNDDFQNANKLDAGGGVLFSNNRFATMQFPQEPLHAGVPTVNATLWWVWSPGFDGPVLIDTAGSEIETVVAVYTNQPLANVREVTSAYRPAGRGQAYVDFNARRGVTYFIVVGGATANDRGSIRLRLEPQGFPDTIPPLVAFTSPPPGGVVTTNWVEVVGVAADPAPASGVAQVSVRLQTDLIGKRAKGTTNWTVNLLLQPGQNTILAQATDFARNASDPVQLVINYVPPTTPNDHFANARVLEGPSGLVDASNQFATREHLEPFHGGNQGGRSIWFRWTSPESGVLTLVTTNVTYDTLLGVYTGTRVDQLTTIASNDDAVFGSRFSKVSFGVEADVVYSIAVDGFAGSSGQAELLYEFAPGPLYRLVAASGGGGRVSSVTGDYAVGTVVTVDAFPDPGYVFERWTGTLTSTRTPLVVTMETNHQVTATFVRPTISDDFELGTFNPELNYNLSPAGSAAPWTVQSAIRAGGQYAARSGSIGGNQKSILALTEPMVAGVVGSFAYRVSTEQFFDFLEFRVNGQLQQRWSGASDWTTYHFVVPQGTNTLEWIYVKDATGNEGEDAVYIDNLNVPVYRPTPSVPVTLNIAIHAGQLQLSLDGAPNGRYRIETSANLLDWQALTTVTADVDGHADFNDTHGTQHHERFYRAVGI